MKTHYTAPTVDITVMNPRQVLCLSDDTTGGIDDFVYEDVESTIWGTTNS